MPKHRSHSQLSTYLSCPKKYDYNYNIKPDIMNTSSALSLGSALHKAQEFNYKQKIKSHIDLPLKEINTFMLEFLIDEFKNNQENPNFFKVLYGKRETPESIMTKATNLLTALYNQVIIETQPLFVELPITLKILGQEIQMYIDLIDSNYCIRDLKTSASKYGEDALRFNAQLVLYALGYRVKFGKKEKGVGLDVVVKTKEPSIQKLRGGTIEDNQINKFFIKLDAVNTAIENKLYPTVDDKMTCDWCAFKDLCAEDGLPDASEMLKKLKNIELMPSYPKEDKK